MGNFATYSVNQVLFQITTSTTIAGSPTFVGGHAYTAFEARGITENAGGVANNNIIIQGALGVAATGSPTWTAMSVTNINNNTVQAGIFADGLYSVSNTQGTTIPYINYVRPFITTLSNVTDGRFDMWCMKQAQVTGN